MRCRLNVNTTVTRAISIVLPEKKIKIPHKGLSDKEDIDYRGGHLDLFECVV